MLTDKGRHLVALALLIAGAVSANMLWAGRAPEVHYKVDFRGVPMQIAGLQGSIKPTEQRISAYLGADACRTTPSRMRSVASI